MSASGSAGAGMLLSSALFSLGTYDDVVDWIWSLGQISSGGAALAHVPCLNPNPDTCSSMRNFPQLIAHACMDSAGDCLHTEKKM